MYDKMTALALPSPSIASLARTFREREQSHPQPRKKPRSAYRRFVYPAPNACWQLDGTEYVLAGGKKCIIFQLQDDHSRLAIASLAAAGETTAAAIEVFTIGVARCGLPQRLLTDNALALNPTRREISAGLSQHVTAGGVEAITGKPYTPTTQGKTSGSIKRYFDGWTNAP
ncbi:hypothetical protein [Corynebacterium uterequi]